MNNSPTIRPMEAIDVDFVIQLWHDCKKEAYPYLPLEQTYTIEDDRAFFNQVIRKNCEIWVATIDGAIKGFLAIADAYVDRLYIAINAQRSGIGTALLNHAKAELAAGFELHTHQKNVSACAFYEKHGLIAVEYGISPPPESEPDVKYRWTPPTPPA